MNSRISRFRLMAAAICGAAMTLSACNAIEDVRDVGSTPVPPEQEVIKGTITGLGYRRPLVLEDIGELRCTDPNNTTGPKIYCRQNFFGNFDESVSHFSLGSVPVGTNYNIQIRVQPYGKTCNFTSSASGIMTADSDLDIGITCVNDTSITRYCVGGTIDPAIRAIPGLRLTLSTEEGLTTLSDDASIARDGPLPPSAQSCWFPNSIFNSGLSLPIFRWYVTATYPAADGTLSNCRVVGGVAGTGSNDLGDATSPLSADVTNLAVPYCNFTIGGTIGYNQQAGVTYVSQAITGLILRLRDTSGGIAKDIAGNDVVYEIPTFTPATATSTNPFTFGGLTPNRFYSNSKALYDVEIVQQPTTGQFCTVAAATTTISVTPVASSTVYPAGAQINGGASARLSTTNPPLTNTTGSTAVAWSTFDNLGNLSVRCRARPGTANNASGTLQGTYQLTTIATATAVATQGTTSTTTVNDPVTTKTRNFMTFFNNGTFIYGTRSGGSGVERGFYYYNTGTGAIAFSIVTDSNNTYTNNTPGSALITNQVGLSALVSTQITSAVKTAGNPSRITARASSTSTTATNNTTTPPTVTVTTTVTDWQLDEPTSVPGEMEGTWTTEDNRRVFIYNASKTFGTHIGVAGAVTFQDACFFLYQLNNEPNYHTAEGYYARRGTSANGTGNSSGGSETSTGCPIGSTEPATTAATLDYYAPPLSQLPGYIWRLPGGQSGFDGRSPSPNYFVITPGAPDSIVITASNQGVPLPATTVTFYRTRSN